jgi:putative oxidoreductase
MKKILFAGTENSLTTDIILALLRLFTGLSLALAHGISKIPPSQGFIEHTGNLGFPLPLVFAWSAGLSEFGGALLLAIGLFTRPAAFFVATTMFVAGFINYAGGPYGNAEKAIMYFGLAIVFLVLGSGRFSLDNFFRKKLTI